MIADNTPCTKAPPRKRRLFVVGLQLFLCVAIIGCGVALATYYLKTSPKAKAKKRDPRPPMVQTKAVTFQSYSLDVMAMGTIQAAEKIELTPGIGGEIIEISSLFAPGANFNKDDSLVTIDPIDYKLTVLQLQTEVAIAQHELDLEMGNQQVALQEFEILGQDVSQSEKRLMLRKPQLDIKHATLKNKQAKLAQAEINLMRTEVLAPFNGVVISREVNRGSRVNQSSVIATLAGTDEYWVKLAVPVEQLQWIEFPSATALQGAEVEIFMQDSDPKNSRFGKIHSLAAGLENQGKMAVAYATIQDPLCLNEKNINKPRLLLNTFVKARIQGVELDSVAVIKRDHLRENNTVWLMDHDDKLEVRPLEIVASTRDLVLVRNGLKDGELLITSGLSSPVAGLQIKKFKPQQKNGRLKKEKNSGPSLQSEVKDS